MVAAPVVQRVNLQRGWVLGQAWDLYKRLFTRSLLLGVILLGAVRLLAVGGGSGRFMALLVFAASLAAGAMLQGGLVEVVRGLHVEGDDDASVGTVIGRANDKLGRLVGVSLLTSLGITIGCVFFLVPGLVLMTRWALAVPVVMNEDRSATDALRRSRTIVRAHGWTVFTTLVCAGLLTVAASIPFLLVGSGRGPLAVWAALTLGSALTAPYFAHVLTVVYYALVDPMNPIVLPPGESNGSVVAPDVPPEPEAPLSIDEEYQRKFEEREKRWGG